MLLVLFLFLFLTEACPSGRRLKTTPTSSGNWNQPRPLPQPVRIPYQQPQPIYPGNMPPYPGVVFHSSSTLKPFLARPARLKAVITRTGSEDNDELDYYAYLSLEICSSAKCCTVKKLEDDDFDYRNEFKKGAETIFKGQFSNALKL